MVETHFKHGLQTIAQDVEWSWICITCSMWTTGRWACVVCYRTQNSSWKIELFNLLQTCVLPIHSPSCGLLAFSAGCLPSLYSKLSCSHSVNAFLLLLLPLSPKVLHVSQSFFLLSRDLHLMKYLWSCAIDQLHMEELILIACMVATAFMVNYNSKPCPWDIPSDLGSYWLSSFKCQKISIFARFPQVSLELGTM